MANNAMRHDVKLYIIEIHFSWKNTLLGGWLGGWMDGWMVGESGNKANSAKLEMELG